MPIFDAAELREDVLDPSYDELQAPELHYLVEAADKYRIYSSSHEFFERTFVSENVLSIMEGIVAGLSGKEAGVFVLHSFFGGGKTHTLMMIYHALKDPDAFLEALKDSSALLPPGRRQPYLERGRRIYEELRRVGSPNVIIISGKVERFFPTPLNPQRIGGTKVRTLWGYIAALLGEYEGLRRHDESLVPPGVDTLSDMLRGKKLVILIDEYVDMVANLLNSGRRVLINYGNQLISFLDNLLSATIGNNTVVVLTIPGEIRGGTLELEPRYEQQRERLRNITISLERSVRRVAARILEPIEPGEFWRILKKRIFKKVDKEKAGVIARTLRTYYEDNPDIFGEVPPHFTEEAQLMYPFHPGYIDALRLILERNRRLNKTRDAIKITRIIVRELYRKQSTKGISEELVMPWHIDPTLEGLSILLAGYEDYRIILEKDVKADSERFGKRAELARIMALTIFLRTYTLRDVVFMSEARKLFPNPQQIARDVFDPGYFTENAWLPSDIIDTLAELPQKLYYLWRADDKYWFWNIPNINEYIERRAEELVQTKREELLEELTYSNDFLKGLVRSLLTRRETGSKLKLSGSYRQRLFEGEPIVEKNVTIDRVPDDEKYKLVVTWNPAQTTPEEIIEKAFKGGRLEPRLYKNTVVVLMPREGLERDVVRLYARLKAINEREQGIRDIRIPGANQAMRRAIIKVQKELISSLRETTTNRLLETLLQGFSILYYPTHKGPVAVDLTRMGVTARCLSEKAEMALADREKALINLDNIDSINIYNYVIKRHANLSNFTTLADINAVFRIKPEAPMIPRMLVKNAIIKAYEERLVIVRKQDGTVFFKGFSADSCDTEGTPLPDLGEYDEVADSTSEAAIEALLNYIENRLVEEELPDGSIKVIEPHITFENREMSLEQLRRELGEDPEMLLDTRLKICLKERVRRPGVRIDVSEKYIELPSEGAKIVRIRVVSIGGREVKQARIRIDHDEGVSAEPDTVELDLGERSEIELKIIGQAPGEHQLIIKAVPINPPGEPDTTTITVAVQSRIKETDCRQIAKERGKVLRIRLNGPYDPMRDFLSDIAQLLMDSALATGARLYHEDTGLEMNIRKPIRLDVIAALIDDIARKIRDYTGSKESPEVEIFVDLGSGVDAKELANYVLNLMNNAACIAELEVSAGE